MLIAENILLCSQVYISYKKAKIQLNLLGNEQGGNYASHTEEKFNENLVDSLEIDKLIRDFKISHYDSFNFKNKEKVD